MRLKTVDGKDYLITDIAKLDNDYIDCTPTFVEIQEAINEILKKYNQKHKTKYTYLANNSYGSNLQSFLNRFSGDYFSPSFLKNYVTNPATCVYSAFCKEAESDATYIGTQFHKILENYYLLPPKERDRKKLWTLLLDVVPDGQDCTTLNEYIQGFIESGDYLKNGPMDDTKLECYTEHSGRDLLTVKSLNYTLPLKTAYVIDRLDYRNGKYYIIDYKTGHPKEEATGFDGYLTSMIIYKWAAEQEYNCTINDGYLLCPGNEEKFMKLDFSKENEQKTIEIIEKFNKQFKRDNARRVYRFYPDKGYFTNEDMANFRLIMLDNTIQMAKIPVEIYIGEEKDRV